MGVGEAGAVTGDKPQTHADKRPSAASAKFDEFKNDLTRKVEAAGEEAGTKELDPSDPFAGTEWKDNPAAAKFAHAEHDRALENEAEGPRPVGGVASMADNAVWQGLGLSVAPGRGGALLAAGGEALAHPILLEGSTGDSAGTWPGTFGEFGPGVSFGANLINGTRDGIEAGSNPISVLSTAATDTIGGRAFEKATNKSDLAGTDLKLTTAERVTGGSFDLLEGSMNIMGMRAFAKVPGVAEAPVPRRTPAEPTVNNTPTSTRKPLSVGSSGVDDVAGTAGKGKAFSGGDAADTVRMRKPASGEGSKPSGATDLSGSNTGETARHLEGGAGDNVKSKKVGSLDISKMQSSGRSAAGAKASAGPAVPTRSVDQIVDAYVQGRSPAEIRNSVSEGDIARMKERYKVELRNDEQDPAIADQISNDQYRRMAMADDIYRHDNRPAAGKPQPTITEAELNAQLNKYDGPTESPDDWHVRMNESPPRTEVDNSRVNADQAHPVDRFYVNVKADHAPEFADYVSGELNKKGIKFQLKVASEIDGYARADSGLVYTQGTDFEAASDVITKYRELHPDAIAGGSPAFTKPVGKGISVTEEPIQEGLPIVPRAHGIGAAQANLIAEAINKAPAAASVEQIKVLARARLQSAGFDPERPWLAQGSKVDRFRDINVARSNAANAGAAVDDTMPVPAAEAGPAPLPRERGDRRGNAAEQPESISAV